jgi:serine protease Do
VALGNPGCEKEKDTTMSTFLNLLPKRYQMYSCLLFLVFVLSSWPPATAQTREGSRSANVLHQLNESIEELVERVSPTVVQILVTGYGAAEETQRGQTDLLVGRRRAIGSGVIVDPEGYIVTNAHVVNGAQNIEVLVPPPPAPTVTGAALEGPQGRSYQARIVGTSREIDLAVIKIDGHGLPWLPIRNSMPPARQGEMVFAFGSPEGLRNTVTMGVVSAVARQPDPDSPLVYVQTDTPINPGNSGGALVNANGDLVGINTFILSSSGGNQGLGFAIPEGVVASAYPQLVKFGHIHQPAIGALVQTITPELAAALRLKRDYGVIISDISPGGPADTAGIKIQDVVLNVDGVAISSLPQFAQSLYLHKTGDHAVIEILRGSDRLKINVGLMERPHKEDSLVDLTDPIKNLVRPLDILGVELTLDLARELPDLRIPTGVIVAARTLGARTGEIPLQTGDVIHGLNSAPIASLDGLRAALAAMKPGEPVALQIERHEQIFYVSFTR